MNQKIRKITLLFLTLVFLLGMMTANTSAAPLSDEVWTDNASLSGLPGSIVTYTVNITSVAGGSLTVNADSTAGWTDPAVVPDVLTFAPGETKSVSVNVPIPDTASDGQNDITVVKVTQGTNTVGTLQLKTIVALPAPTKTPAPTSVPGRPLVTIASYSTGDKILYAGNEMNLQVVLGNNGKVSAENIIVTFDGADFYPRESGGVRTTGTLPPGDTNTINQKFLIGDALAWANVASIKATVNYTDPLGTPYSESFTISVVIAEPSSSGYYATATPNIPQRPQLVVTGYSTDIDPLQPGSIFELKLDVKNLGLADARGVTAVIGGGAVAGDDMGTPQPGGISGGGSDLTTFAPLGSSNVIFVGDINKDMTAAVTQKLVVNVTAQPGAYSLKLSFVYNDARGNRLVDDQIITLLVYSLPQVEVSFYRDAGMLTAGMENILPLQVTNLGRKTYVLGNLKVTAENADLFNNVLLIGALDPGGYYTLDASLMPYQEGPLDLKVVINYTDDFNQPRFIEQVIPVEIQPAMEVPPDMGEGGMPDGEVIVEPTPETFWQKVVRFFKGLIGLDSGIQQPVEQFPVEDMPSEEVIPVPAIPKG
ncbi:MAG TPA: hypothetical protein PKK59_05610 [Anaerolineaceae bacterium]|nr:hypothetical protein [Anaerolineaceae bacterium]